MVVPERGQIMLRGTITKFRPDFFIPGADRGDDIIGATKSGQCDFNGGARRFFCLEKDELVVVRDNHGLPLVGVWSLPGVINISAQKTGCCIWIMMPDTVGYGLQAVANEPSIT